jgi:hypothetical protein
LLIRADADRSCHTSCPQLSRPSPEHDRQTKGSLSCSASFGPYLLLQRLQRAVLPFRSMIARSREDVPLMRCAGAVAGRGHWLRAAQQVRPPSAKDRTARAVALSHVCSLRQVQSHGQASEFRHQESGRGHQAVATVLQHERELRGTFASLSFCPSHKIASLMRRCH